MIDFTFYACGNCIHMRVIEKDGKKLYYCPFAKNDIPDGVVDPTFDAIKCIREGHYCKRTS